MKRIAFLLSFLIIMVAHGRMFKKVEMIKVPGTDVTDIKLAGVSPTGEYALVTTANNVGLSKVMLESGESVRITRALGAGIQPEVSADGKKVIYREVTYGENHRRSTALKTISLEDGACKDLCAPVRRVQPYGFVGEEAYVISENSSLKSKSLVSATNQVTVYLKDLQLMVNQGGKETCLSPNGTDVNYLWPSLSPDGRYILYYVSEKGAYVCNLDGSGVKFIAYDCRAPQWYDNNTVVGMNDKDNGKTVLTSSIVAYTLDGESQSLTEETACLMYPYCVAEKNMIVCSSLAGGLYCLMLDR